MSVSVCTLFEGSYHSGVAALVNSLVFQGYSGLIYVGYRGTLPEWVCAGQSHDLAGFVGVTALTVSADLTLFFIPLETERHLTNYKSAFMLRLFESIAEERLFYLDPDVCVNARWSYFEEWISCGIALCEDGNSPFYEFHPRRMGWRSYYGKLDIELRFKFDMYINAGAIGVGREQIGFLETWENLVKLMGPEIDGLDQTIVGGGTSPKTRDFLFCFQAADQDALNAAIEAYDGQYSVQNKSAMGAPGGLAIVPHALGFGKPWQVNYLINALKGRLPREVDRVFWNSLENGPLQPMSRKLIQKKMKEIKAATLLVKLKN